MGKLQDTLRFKDDFPPVSTAEWEEKIRKDLKGSDYNRKLIWNTLEGFTIRPYYRSEDLKRIVHAGVYPAEFPWVRSKKDQDNTWYIRQDIDVRNDVEAANREVLDILNRGAGSIGFSFTDNNLPDDSGFDALLEDICIQAIELNFQSGHRSGEILRLLREKIGSDNIDKKKVQGSTDFNPLGCLSRTGKFYTSADEEFDEAKKLIELASDLPGFSVLEVDAALLHNAGSSIVQELGFGLAMGNDYLAHLTDRGLSVDEVARNIKFHFGVGPAYFLEIAKFRAARMLWAKVVESYGPSSELFTQMKIHASTSQWNQTVYDPYVNMLRGTTEAMSASLGGADSISLTPYDKAFEKPTGFAKRIARNTQIILKEEAYFDKVVDPAGGAYYIEELTQSIAEHAWKLFQEVEKEGGYMEAFKKGIVQKKIEEVANTRNMNLAMRKEALVGINLYPNPNEVMEKGYNESTILSASEKAKDAVANPIKPHRGAEEIELLRLKTERNSENRPVVFMLTIGDKKMRRARAQFSAGFFAAAGFEIIDNIGFSTVGEAAKEVQDKSPDIVVICSSDQEYAELVPDIYRRLQDKAMLVVAGYPKESIEELKQIGIRYFIHIKSNLVKTLQTFQKELGIE